MQAFSKRLHELRTEHQWSMQTLADLSKVSKSMICKIEAGDVQPTLDVAARLAMAFNISLSEMLEPSLKQSVLLIKNQHHSCFEDPISKIKRFVISPTYAGCKVEWLRVLLPAKASSGSLPGSTFQYKKKYIYVLSGMIEVCFENQIYQIESGDSFYVEAKGVHEIKNPGKMEAEYFIVMESQ